MTRTINVAEGVATGRLDVYLASELGLSRAKAAGLIKRGEVTIEGEIARASQEVVVGQTIVVAASVPTARPSAAPELPIVYEDDDIIVVDKPAGVVVHSGNAQDEGGTVVDFARSRTTDDDPDRPGIVHRLDKETSGLLVIAKTTAAKQSLQRQWQDRTVKKTYRLLVVGRVQPAVAVIDLPLDRDKANPTRRAVSPSGRPAVTRYQTIASYPGYSYLEAYPETGRTHQLRVHFASTGHPVAGDIVYGAAKRPLGLSRQFLHAAELSFVTPSGRQLKFTSELPGELQDALSRLKVEAKPS